MSIEIIEKPTHKCSVCGCVFSFEKEDLEKVAIGDSPLGKAHKLYLHCPVCDSCDLAFEDGKVWL